MKKGKELEIDIIGIEFPNKPYGKYEDKKVYPQGNFIVGNKVKGITTKIRNKKVVNYIDNIDQIKSTLK